MPRTSRTTNDARAAYTIQEHFDGRDRAVAEIYAKLLAAARKLGPVREEPKKTSIHLARETAFAGVVTRKDALILTLKSARDLAGPRIGKREQTSANRWHVEIRLTRPSEVDRELLGWLKKAYELAG